MGYFSNGTEGDLYEERYCARCIHSGNCAVWDAHILRNYVECNNENSILHILIPRSEDGRNEQCLMFVEKPADLYLEAATEIANLDCDENVVRLRLLEAVRGMEEGE